MLWMLQSNGSGDGLTGLELGPWHCYVPARDDVVVCVVVRAGFAVTGCETALSAQFCSSTD